MSVSKTGVVLFIVLFFITLSTLVGAYEKWSNTQLNPTGEKDVNIGGDSFIHNVVNGYAELPTALNVIIFSTLGVLIAWVVFSSLPTINGGS